MNTEKVDVLVIGAGPAGTVAASIVNKAGYKVKIVEKMIFPRFVIGESLLPRCMEALTEAGFVEAVKEKGFQEKSGAKFVKNGKICDYLFADQFTPGWNWTWQVPRAEFDKTLADTVEKMGVPVSYETTVTKIVFNDDATSVTTVTDKNGIESQIEARFIIDGSGYGRVIPRLFNLDRPSNLPPRKALFAHTKDLKRSMSDEPNRITIVVHEKGIWIWIIPFSSGITSLGFVGEPEFFKKYGGNNEEQLRALIASQPYIAERFENVELIFEPRVLESWSSTTDKFYGNGFVLTGNVTEFLDPVFSSGVTLATVSSQIAANLVIKKLKGEDVDWQKEYTEPMMQGVDTFRSYVMAWYEGTLDTIFFADDQDPVIKSMICSVLAGYVWDLNNPYVKEHKTALEKLARIIELRDMFAKKTGSIVPLQNYITASTVISTGAIYKDKQVVFEAAAAHLTDFLLATYQHFEIKYSKFYKMDNLGKLGWLAAEIMLKDSEITERYDPYDVGVVFSNANSSLDTDIKYYDSTKEIASPALFVYTLPNIVIGEICIRHHIKGENSFFIFDKFDAAFIEHNVNGLLNNDTLQACICGWVEVIGEQYKAALYLVEKPGNRNLVPFDVENINKIYQLENG